MLYIDRKFGRATLPVTRSGDRYKRLPSTFGQPVNSKEGGRSTVVALTQFLVPSNLEKSGTLSWY